MDCCELGTDDVDFPGGCKPLLVGALGFPCCGGLEGAFVPDWVDGVLVLDGVFRQLDPPLLVPSTDLVGDVLGEPDNGHPGAGIFLKLDLVESPLELEDERAVGLVSPAVPFRLGF